MESIEIYDYSRVKQEHIDLCEKVQAAIHQYGDDKIMRINGERSRAPQVFKYLGQDYYSTKYVGILYYEDEKTEATITIRSRFDSGESQNFLNYMFTKVYRMRGNIFKEMNPKGSIGQNLDILLMFVYLQQLTEALRKGYYRSYCVFQHNDFKVKGKIEVGRHLRQSMMFTGKISYTTREYTIDNAINRLILLTYRSLKKRYGSLFSHLINQEDMVRRALQSLENEIEFGGDLDSREILKHTVKPISHPLYYRYEVLRRTCRMILKRLGFNLFADEGNKVSGVLIDIALLWEQFLQQALMTDNNVASQYNHSILDKKRTITPDFFKKDKAVFDAKYRKAWEGNCFEDGKWDNGVRNDVFQVFAYMYSLNVPIGGVIFPTSAQMKVVKYAVSDYLPDRTFYTIPYVIERRENYEEFEKGMEEQNKKLQDLMARY